MEGSFPNPFSANLSSFNRFLTQHDINLTFDSLWEMVTELNSRTAILLNRIEGSRNLQLQHGVLWMSLGFLMVFCMALGVRRVVVWIFGRGSGRRGDGKKLEREVVEGESDVLGSGKELIEEEDENKAFRLREELEAARQEITRLMPFRDEVDGLRSKIELMTERVADDENELERLKSLEKDLASVRSECEVLKEDIQTRDIEIGKLQASETEVKELRSHLETCKEEVSTMEMEIESLKTEKSKIEQDLEIANKELETVTQRAASFTEIEEKLQTENSDLTQKLADLTEESKARQDTQESDLAKQQLLHEQEKQQLREEYEGKVKEAREGTRRRSDSVASSSPAEMERSPGRRTPTRFLASLKRHSRSSLGGSFSGSPSKPSKESETSK